MKEDDEYKAILMAQSGTKRDSPEFKNFEKDIERFLEKINKARKKEGKGQNGQDGTIYQRQESK
jgi:soluble cytochrome b562